MSLLWIDGFDHYGADAARLTEGVYASASGVTLSNLNPRTGARAARVGGGFETGLRRIFGEDLDAVGVGYAFLIPTLPSDSGSLCLATFRTNGNTAHCSLMVSSTGQLVLRRGERTGEILGTSAPVVAAGAYQHFECRVGIGDTDGTFEARLNGVTVLNLSGLDNRVNADPMAQVQIGTSGQGTFGFPAYMMVDDLFAWSDAGTSNNDFIGDKKVYTGFPNADTAVEEWSPSIGANSYAMLDNVPPQDATEYLAAADPGLTSQFGLDDLPTEVVAIAGIMTAVRTFKSDAGDAKVRVDIDNGTSPAAAGADHALTQAPRWYHDVFEVDPATASAWTAEGFNTAELALTRIE